MCGIIPAGQPAGVQIGIILYEEKTVSDTILVTYATRYGSTQEVAEKIAATLREGGLAVDVQPVKQVRTLDGYRAVVVGAPLYMFDWLKEARDFLARPVAVFALGPTEDKEKDWTETREQLDKVLSKFSWLTPVAVELFGGKFDPARLAFPYNLVPGLKRMPVNDIRDWDAIRAWAEALHGKLA
ncbi:MAG: flavodoxin domain-containing protein [Anaerolineae bacterium]|nr:flavodoxin domain-containing protein [Anaerolineae bacterium]